jgi:hypothetical protein
VNLSACTTLRSIASGGCDLKSLPDYLHRSSVSCDVVALKNPATLLSTNMMVPQEDQVHLLKLGSVSRPICTNCTFMQGSEGEAVRRGPGAVRQSPGAEWQCLSGFHRRPPCQQGSSIPGKGQSCRRHGRLPEGQRSGLHLHKGADVAPATNSHDCCIQAMFVLLGSPAKATHVFSALCTPGALGPPNFFGVSSTRQCVFV